MSKKTNPLTQFSGQFQTVSTKLTAALERRGTNVVDMMARLAQQRSDSVIEQIADLMTDFTNQNPNALVVDYSIHPSRIDLPVEKHTDRKDKVTIDVSKIKLVTELRSGETYVHGHENRKRLDAKVTSGEIQTLLDARVMEELLAKPELIPDEWKGKMVFFWGTIFWSGGGLCVACLRWDDGRWVASFYWLDTYVDSSTPAAVLASAN